MPATEVMSLISMGVNTLIKINKSAMVTRISIQLAHILMSILESSMTSKLSIKTNHLRATLTLTD